MRGGVGEGEKELVSNNDSVHLTPQSNENTDNARPYLVAIVVCTIYILAIDLIVLITEGMTSGEIPVFLFKLVVLVGVVLTLRNTPKGLLILGITAKIYFVLVVVFQVVSLTILG